GLLGDLRTVANYPAANTKTRRRLQRTPPRPGRHRVTRFWYSAPLYGRCLLLEANLCVDASVFPDRKRTAPSLRRRHANVKTDFLNRPKQLGERLVWKGRRERLVEKEDLLDRQRIPHEHRAGRHTGEADDAKPVVRRRLLSRVLHRPECMRAP